MVWLRLVRPARPTKFALGHANPHRKEQVPKKLDFDQLGDLLRKGDFLQLVGSIEDEGLECKKTPYRLDDDSQKRELAKDVSGFANGVGGIILLGVETYKNPTHSGDEIKLIHPFPQTHVDASRYNEVLLRWVYPTIRNFEICWFASIQNPNEGIVAITVPQQPSTQRPFLITRTIEPGTKGNRDKVGEVLFGYAERRRDETRPMSVEELQARLKDGLHFDSLARRLESIEETLGKLRSELSSPLLSEPTTTELLDQRIGLALSELDAGSNQPTFILAFTPSQRVEIQNLFATRDAEIVRLLESPPKLRPSGFDLDTGGYAARIVEGGNRRRSLAPKYKTLNLWRDGTLIFAADALDFPICFRPDPQEGVPLRINQLALIESTFLFSEVSKQVLKEASPEPSEILYRLELRNITVDGVNCGLVPGVVGDNNWIFGRDIHRAQGSTVKATTRWNGEVDVGRVSYQIICSVYEQFGLEHDKVPYREKAGDDFVISPDEMRRLHAR